MATSKLYNPMPAAQRNITVFFTYIDRSHVKLYRRTHTAGLTQDTFEGTELVDGTDYEWLNSGTIALTTAASGSDDYLLRRETPTGPIVVQQPGVFSSKKVNLAVLQAIYLAEEAEDFASGVADAVGNVLARSLRVPTDETIPVLPSASERAGKFQAYDGGGRPIMSEGVGVDSGLFLTVPTAPFISIPKTGLTDQSAAINAAIASQGMIEFPAYPSPGRYGLASSLSIARSNVHLRFHNGAALVPISSSAPAQMIDIRGSAPTSWVPLAADAYANSAVLRFSSDPGWAVGQWVELRSNRRIATSINYKDDLFGDCHRVNQRLGSGPYYFVLDGPLAYDFLVADGAVAGVATMLENITIEAAQLNDEEFANLIKFGIRAQYCAGLKLIRPKGFGSKLPQDSSALASGDFIKLINCVDTYIEDPHMTHGSYYGLSIMGWTKDLKSYGGVMTNVRHAVSYVQSSQQSIAENPSRTPGYGEPHRNLVHGMTSLNSFLSGFDTHDTGFDLVYEECVAVGSGDDGFQFRSPKVKAISCEARGSAFDGFSHNDMLSSGKGAADCELINCKSIANGRLGANFRYNRAFITGGEFRDNGTASSRPECWTSTYDALLDKYIYTNVSPPPAQGTAKQGAGGVRMNGGRICGAVIENNAGSLGAATGSAIIYGDATAVTPMRPLEIEGVTAPASALQTRFLSLASSSAVLNFGQVTLAGDNTATGYGDRLFDNLGVQDNISPLSLGGNHLTEDASKRRGVAQLVGGYAWVDNTAVRNKKADTVGEAILSRISLFRSDPDGVVRPLDVHSIVDGLGFAVVSSGYLEPTRTNVIRNNTNVGAATGTPGTLPTNWSATAISGLALNVVATGTETGPLGGTQNYIDLRVVGTAGATGVITLAFDTSTNPAAAAAPGQVWTASFGGKLVAGAMTGIAANIILSSRDSGGNPLDNLFTSIAFTGTGRRFTRTGTFTTGAAFARGMLTLAVNSGAVVDATIRLYMPQLEQAQNGSAPIATSGSAATRTQDPSAGDNSTFEWVHTF